MTDIAISLLSAGMTLEDAAAHIGAAIDRDEQGRQMICTDGWTADAGDASVDYPLAASATEAARNYVDDGSWGEIESTVWVRVSTWRRGVCRVECAYCSEPATAHDSEGDPACAAHAPLLERIRSEDAADRRRATACAAHAETPADGVVLADLIVETESAHEQHCIAIDPPEPPCIDGEDHDWQSPHEIVGGLEDNPGVWGHGGGVLIHRVCMRCGCGRHEDTWAQDPETGEQGLESVRYVPDEHLDDLGSDE